MQYIRVLEFFTDYLFRKNHEDTIHCLSEEVISSIRIGKTKKHMNEFNNSIKLSMKYFVYLM